MISTDDVPKTPTGSYTSQFKIMQTEFPIEYWNNEPQNWTISEIKVVVMLR